MPGPVRGDALLSTNRARAKRDNGAQTLVSTSEGGDFAAEAEWWSSAPPEVIEPLGPRIDFSWKKPRCLRDLRTVEDCPQPSLPSVPSTCQAPTLDAGKSVCKYSCSASVPAGVHGGFSLPTTVEFRFGAAPPTTPPPRESKGPTSAPGSFSASLAYAGQVIEGDVNERQRDVLVRFEGWPLDGEVGKLAIHHISILERDGRALPVVPRTGLVLAPFPGLSCDDQVQYDLVGDLRLPDRGRAGGHSAKKQTPCPAGALCLQTPKALLDEPLTLGFAAYGGGYYPVGTGTSSADTFTNQAIGARWMAALEAVGRFNRWWPPFDWERWRFPWHAPVLGDWLEGRLGLITSFIWASGLSRSDSAGQQKLLVNNAYTYIRIDGTLHLTWSIMDKRNPGPWWRVAVRTTAPQRRAAFRADRRGPGSGVGGGRLSHWTSRILYRGPRAGGARGGGDQHLAVARGETERRLARDLERLLRDGAPLRPLNLPRRARFVDPSLLRPPRSPRLRPVPLG